MIGCPVCGGENHHLSVTCSSCGGFIQTRVDNLDLFSTIWLLIEHPGKAFHRIALARYKNYSTILAAISGVGIVFTYFWYLEAADHTRSMLYLVAAGLLLGPPAGVLLNLTITAGLRVALSLFRVSVRFRNLYAVLAYAMVPIVLSVFFLLPLEIYSLGRYFFSMNPPPWMVKPGSYYTFLVLDAVVGVWFFALGSIGVKTLLDSKWKTAMFVMAGVFLVLAGIGLLADILLATGAPAGPVI